MGEEFAIVIKDVSIEEEDNIIDMILNNMDMADMPLVEMNEVLRSEDNKDIAVIFRYMDEDEEYDDSIAEKLMRGISHEYSVERDIE